MNVIKARPTDLGGFSVRRALPHVHRRNVGPFVFLDHMGPSALAPGGGIDVRPHPHVGLATVTFLFEGELLHRDSLGTVQRIQPGAVNWMNAGRGIVHSERTPPELRSSGPRVHGIQAWVALPLDAEDSAPAFQHHPASALPRFSLAGAELVLIAGAAYGHVSPVRVASPMFYLELRLAAGKRLDWPADYAERAIYVVQGTLNAAGRRCEAGELLHGVSGEAVTLEAESDVHAMLVGGAALDAPRYLWWNFVASSEQRIEQAKQAWRERRFPPVPEENEFIPLPADIGRPAPT